MPSEVLGYTSPRALKLEKLIRDSTRRDAKAFERAFEQPRSEEAGVGEEKARESLSQFSAASAPLSGLENNLAALLDDRSVGCPLFRLSTCVSEQQQGGG
ncbi:hypothetical protein BST61_g3078 [Cercospora zeina]